ncbi:acylneuraminate cytidylyltransferase family protein [Pontimonas sp.]|nr:acylneuraminate cytidylyltransferase family protein [Pontimonas sp.]
MVIPARGGSKGIPHKNIAPVAGKPLISYTTELLSELPWVDVAVVSTDDADIAEEALRAGTAEILWRPAELSGDRIGDMPVLAHALRKSEAPSSEPFDVVVMLQPTSPLRTASEVEECVDKLIDEDWDAVWTVSETDLTYHPQKQVRLSPDGVLNFYLESGSRVVTRQELEAAFHRNGVCYAFSAAFVRRSDSVFAPGASTAVITTGSQISIDTQADIRRVESELSRRNLGKSLQ